MHRFTFSMCVLLACGMLSHASTTAPTSRPAKPPADEKLTASSVFMGSQSGDPRLANSRNVAATFKVTAREKNEFTGEYIIRPGNGRRALKVRGKVDPKTGALLMQPTAIVVGEWPSGVLDEVWEGKINGESFGFERKVGKAARGVIVELTYEDNPKSEKPK